MSRKLQIIFQTAGNQTDRSLETELSAKDGEIQLSYIE